LTNRSLNAIIKTQRERDTTSRVKEITIMTMREWEEAYEEYLYEYEEYATAEQRAMTLEEYIAFMEG
jgi:hypothetical protein